MANHPLQYDWKEAFNKFGYDDGDGMVETAHVARILEDAGYQVKYSRWSPHNTIIYSIRKNGTEFMPLGHMFWRIGYDDPMDYLPKDIVAVLNAAFLK